MYVNGAICPDKALITAVEKLQFNEALVQGDLLISACIDNKKTLKYYLKNNVTINSNSGLDLITYEDKITQIKNKWDIFLLNEEEIFKDFRWVTEGKSTQGIQDKNTIAYNGQNIFIGEHVIIKAAILNAERGPIYIGNNVVINEGAVIKGPSAICEGAQVNMHTRLYNGTTIGPSSKVGGEIDNSVIFGYSNKLHEGFMGHSVIGEWCNIGAGTNISNLKNDYNNITIWSYEKEEFMKTNLQFCGLFMGDHSKCGVNTMTNAGTIMGVSANIFGAGFCDKFIPSFTWGGTAGVHTTTYGLNKALEVAEKSLQRKQKNLPPMLFKEDKEILSNIFRITAMNRVKATM